MFESLVLRRISSRETRKLFVSQNACRKSSFTYLFRPIRINRLVTDMSYASLLTAGHLMMNGKDLSNFVRKIKGQRACEGVGKLLRVGEQMLFPFRKMTNPLSLVFSRI